MHEDLIAASERRVAKSHPLITYVTVSPLKPTDTMRTLTRLTPEQVIASAQSDTLRELNS